MIKKQHLLIVIDNNKNIVPKKYSLEFGKLSKEEFIKQSKQLYEKTNKNFNYETYYFEHII